MSTEIQSCRTVVFDSEDEGVCCRNVESMPIATGNTMVIASSGRTIAAQPAKNPMTAAHAVFTVVFSVRCHRRNASSNSTPINAIGIYDTAMSDSLRIVGTPSRSNAVAIPQNKSSVISATSKNEAATAAEVMAAVTSQMGTCSQTDRLNRIAAPGKYILL